jgi:hypothetical protein
MPFIACSSLQPGNADSVTVAPTRSPSRVPLDPACKGPRARHVLPGAGLLPIALMLAACGGGGADSAVSSDPAPTPAPVAATPSPSIPAPTTPPATTPSAPVASPTPPATAPSAPATTPTPSPPAASPPSSPVAAPSAPVASPPPAASVRTFELTCEDPVAGTQYSQSVVINPSGQPWGSLTLLDKRPGFSDDPDGSVARSGAFVAGNDGQGHDTVAFGPVGGETVYLFAGENLDEVMVYRGGRTPPIVCR